jgi:alpha/beta superfamily hydrolase
MISSFPRPSTIPETAVAAPLGVSAPRSARLRSIALTGPAGSLEAILNEGAADAPCAALVCHPHPLGGGNLHNKVVYHAMKALNDPAFGLGWPVLRFNFRGTGLSRGAHDGQAEAEDVLAALDWLVDEYRLPLAVVGYSFGAVMALAACCGASENRRNIRAIAALGLPLQAEGADFHYPFLAGCALPKLFLSGDLDQYAPAEALMQVVGSAAEPKRLHLLHGADHFFAGHLQPMQSALSGWMKDQIKEQVQ